MFGIGAYDNTAKRDGAYRAYNEGWAAKQVSNIKAMYAQLDNPILVFDVPRYK